MVDKGDITIEAITGTGRSTGTVVDAVLVNRSPIAHNINVRLDVPIFFVNRGAGQNMVATHVYGQGGSYFLVGSESFVEVAGNSRTPIVLLAYCVDFEKDNPTSNEYFKIGELPAEIEGIMRSIAMVQQENSDLDITVSAQLALWVVQGESLENIRKKFSFDEQEDVDWMKRILQANGG